MTALGLMADIADRTIQPARRTVSSKNLHMEDWYVVTVPSVPPVSSVPSVSPVAVPRTVGAGLPLGLDARNDGSVVHGTRARGVGQIKYCMCDSECVTVRSLVSVQSLRKKY